MFKRKPKVLTPEETEAVRTKDFFDCILPGTVKFLSDHYIVGDSCRSVWAIREYPPSTEEQAILSQLADRNGVTLRIYHRLVEAGEQRKIRTQGQACLGMGACLRSPPVMAPAGTGGFWSLRKTCNLFGTLKQPLDL